MNKNIAFTLIELLVVIAVIGILSGLIVISMGGITNKANIAKIQIFSNSLRNSLISNVVSEWRFDEGSGTSIKDSWSGLSGTLYNFTDTNAGYGDNNTSGWLSSNNCPSGTCLKFDGVDDYVSYTLTNPAMTSFTLEAWLNPNNYSTTSTSVIIGRGGTYYFWQYYNSVGPSGCWVLELYNDGTRRNFDLVYSLLPLKTWTHIAMTYDGSKITVYKNGAYFNIKTVGTVIIPATTNGEFRIGTVNYTGMIDGVKSYNAPAPLSKIKQNYYLGLNNLFSNKIITYHEYLNRIGDLDKNITQK